MSLSTSSLASYRRGESPLLRSARVQDGQGERVMSATGVEMTNESGLSAVREHIETTLEAKFKEGFPVGDENNTTAEYAGDADAKAALREFSGSLATGLFDRSDQSELAQAGQKLTELAQGTDAAERANALLTSFANGAQLNDRDFVEVMLTQVEAAQSLGPLPASSELTSGSQFWAQATDRVNSALEALPNVSAVTTAQTAMYALQPESAQEHTPAEVAGFLRGAAQALESVHGEATSALQNNFKALAEAVESGQDTSAQAASVQGKLDELARSVAGECMDSMRSHVPGLQEIADEHARGAQERADTFLEAVSPDGKDFSGATVSRMVQAVEQAYTDTGDSPDTGATSREPQPDVSAARNLLGEAAQGYSDEQLVQALGAEVPELAQSMGITAQDVSDAVQQLQETAALEGRDPAQVDAAVALDSLVMQELAHEGAQLEASLQQDRDNPSQALERESAQEPEDSPEREMEMDGGE